MKRLVTVCWSYTVEADLPEGVGVEELEAFDSGKQNADLADSIVKEAASNLNWKDGVITSVECEPDYTD
jgi:hypothetical protein